MNNYELRAVKGSKLERLSFIELDNRRAIRNCYSVRENFAPNSDLWRTGKIVLLDDMGVILHKLEIEACDCGDCDECNAN